MHKCKFPSCKINKGMCDSQHRCFTCGDYMHIMCSYSIMVKETGEYWEHISFPGNCYECNEDIRNRVMNLKKLEERTAYDFDDQSLVSLMKITLWLLRNTAYIPFHSICPFNKKKIKKMGICSKSIKVQKVGYFSHVQAKHTLCHTCPRSLGSDHLTLMWAGW